MFLPRSVTSKKARAPSSTAPASRPPPVAPSTLGDAAASSTSSSAAAASSSVGAASTALNAAQKKADAAAAQARAKAAAEQRKTELLARELALMLAFVLSDHALSDDSCGLGLGKWMSRLTYLPLNTILKHPSFQPLPSPLPPPAAIAKALRQYAPQLDARILLDEPRSFGGSRGLKEGSGGLEITRVGGWKPVADIAEVNRVGSLVYLEYLPSSIHSPLALLSFLQPLLPNPEALVALSPAPYRNYAHLTFANPVDAAAFCASWSWAGARERARGKGRASAEEEGGGLGAKEREEAVKAGMRALPIAEYQALEQEYLALLAARRRAITPPAEKNKSSAFVAAPPALPPASSVASTPPRQPDYPEACLVFLKHVDPGTSKTALKTSVAHLLAAGAQLAGREARADAQASYIDWVKGGDSAHVRLPHASLSAHLLVALSKPSYHLPLTSAPPHLSASPPPDFPTARPLAAELVAGERERLYWMAGGVKEAGRKEALRVAGAWEEGVSGEKRKAGEEEGRNGGRKKRKGNKGE